VHFDLAGGSAGGLAAARKGVKERCFSRLGETNNSKTHIQNP
jgi:hypothetical protein